MLLILNEETKQNKNNKNDELQQPLGVIGDDPQADEICYPNDDKDKLIGIDDFQSNNHSNQPSFRTGIGDK